MDEVTIGNFNDGGLFLNASGALTIGSGNAIISDSSGTTTLSNIDALDATTGATIKSEVVSVGPITITQGSTGGGTALLIDNNDVDQVALGIDAVVNTTANAINVEVNALTTGSAVNIDAHDTLTASATKTLLDIDYDKAGVTASGQASATTGISINMADGATNHADGQVTMTGMQIDVDNANAQGTITSKGIILNVAADGVADTARSFGIEMEVIDGAPDIKMKSHADPSDYCTIATTANGATTITTVDNGAAAAHFEVAADGDIILDAAGTIKLEGPVRPTGQIQMTYHSYKADQDTTKTYLGLLDADSEETATSSKVDLPLTAPVAGKLLKVFLRSNKNLNSHTLTWRLETISSGANFSSTPAVIGTQSGAGCQNTTMTTYDFTTGLDSGTNAIAAADAVHLSLQSDTDFGSNVIYYVTCLWEWDLS